MSSSQWIIFIAVIIGIILVVVFFSFMSGGCGSCKESFTVVNTDLFSPGFYAPTKPYLTCSPYENSYPSCGKIVPEQRPGRCPNLLRCGKYAFHDYGFGAPLVRAYGGNCYPIC